MINKILSLISLICLSTAALAQGSYDEKLNEPRPVGSILGQWTAQKLIYKGQDMPPRDPRLKINFEFLEDGTDRLFWTYDEGKTFCERKGQYVYKDNFLVDEIYWVNPANKGDCGSDPDMQLGRRTISKLEIKEASESPDKMRQMYLYVPLGDEDIIYVWKELEK